MDAIVTDRLDELVGKEEAEKVRERIRNIKEQTRKNSPDELSLVGFSLDDLKNNVEEINGHLSGIIEKLGILNRAL